ncbi:DUF917 domain-containing protein [Parasphingorhabdus sp. DH2-15]|uniref:DUF917 domain-containing protein n=1 Tax=Parasphingorhabdus sp. DH2-15 TaxID=3444112 RepID=UPI003F686E65
MLARRHFMAGAVAIGGLGALASCKRVDDAGGQSNGAAAKESRSNDRGSLLTAQMLEDALVGSSYLGCGGGGSLKLARELIAGDLEAGQVFRLLSISELEDDERVSSPYSLASLAPPGEEILAKLEAIEKPVKVPTFAAFSLLEKHLDTQFAAVILGEIGPLSMAEGLSTAARLGVPALDADTVGRATPEINQHSVRVAGHPLTPAAGVTPFGDEVVLTGLQDPSREEDLFRALAVVSREIGVADAPITGKIAKSDGALVKDSFTLARKIGEAVRLAQTSGADPIEAARAQNAGYHLFRGNVMRFDWEDKDGFLVGDLLLSGVGEFTGQEMLVDYKNEHLVARRDGKVVATCPDLITVVDTQTYEGINNPDFTVGQEVAVLGYKCDPLWRKPAGLDVFAPRYFGYDVDYVPIEKRLST